MGMMMVLIMVPLLAIVVLSLIYVMPITNRMFSLVWEDPEDKHRRLALKRLKELHVDGNVPEETAILMTAREFNASERELMLMLGMFSASDLMGVLTGKRGVMGVISNELRKNLKRGA